jgi:hypothetical protein
MGISTKNKEKIFVIGLLVLSKKNFNSKKLDMALNCSGLPAIDIQQFS